MLGSVKDPLDAQRLVRALKKLPGVNTAEVTSGPRGIEAVKVLVDRDRDRSETVADVLATATITLDVHLLPESVNVIEQPARESASSGPVNGRDRLSGLAVWRNDEDILAMVSLDGEERNLEGAHRALSGQSQLRSVAEATLDAIAPLLRSHLYVREAAIVAVGPERVALVMVADEHDVLVGAAAVRVDETDSIARATLDAVNRWIA